MRKIIGTPIYIIRARGVIDMNWKGDLLLIWHYCKRNQPCINEIIKQMIRSGGKQAEKAREKLVSANLRFVVSFRLSLHIVIWYADLRIRLPSATRSRMPPMNSFREISVIRQLKSWVTSSPWRSTRLRRQYSGKPTSPGKRANLTQTQSFFKS